MITFTKDIHGNLYYQCTYHSWIMIVCMVTDVEEANRFCEDNPDCGVLSEHGGVIFIAFNEDHGKEVV